MRGITVLRAGVVEHGIVAEEMRRLQKLRLENKIQDTLIFVEHPEIVTIGPVARRDGVVVPSDYPTSPIDRGGGITWHGEGQLTVYPIFHWNKDGEANVARITEKLESWIISVLQQFGIEAERDARMQGVWIESQKVASIGLAFLKWVSRHGFTINYDTPAGRVEALAACGLEQGTTTSLSALGKHGLTREKLESALLESVENILNRKVGEVIEVEQFPSPL